MRPLLLGPSFSPLRLFSSGSRRYLWQRARRGRKERPERRTGNKMETTKGAYARCRRYSNGTKKAPKKECNEERTDIRRPRAMVTSRFVVNRGMRRKAQEATQFECATSRPRWASNITTNDKNVFGKNERTLVNDETHL